METIQEYSQEKALPGITRYQFYYWLIWPFGAMIHSLKNFRNPGSKTLFWMFCIYFGLVFIYADPFGKGGADSARYAAKLIQFHQNPYSLTSLIRAFYRPVNGFIDIYEPFTTWIVAIFTDNPQWLFTVFSAVFGFFYAENLWIIFKRINTPFNHLVFLYLLMFALINPLWNINGVRMWTAAQVFLFGIFQFFLLENKKGWIWCGLSVFFHFSFLFPFVLFILYQILPKSVHLFFIFYITASFINLTNLEEIRNLLSFLPDIIYPRVQSYTSEAYLEAISKRASGYSWHVFLARSTGIYILNSWIILLYINFRKWFMNLPIVKSLFLFALFMGGWAQIAGLVPSGGRFMAIANSIFYATIIFILAKSLHKKEIETYATFLAIPLVYVIIFEIRVGFDYIGLLTFAGNPVIALFYEGQTPLIDFVKSIF